jgi:hypothetical protein
LRHTLTTEALMTIIARDAPDRLRAIPAVLVLVMLVTACARPGEDPDAVDSETRERVVAVAEPAATALARTLSGRLLDAVAEGGPAGAIEFCSREAVTLTDGVVADLGEGWAVKRTALRTRNPANVPDALEARALDRFHAAESDGGGLEDHVQRTAGGDFRYYRPLRIAPLCLECHGDPEAMQPAVRRALEDRYPDDAATGYADGDLRGLIRVSVPASAMRTAAPPSAP